MAEGHRDRENDIQPQVLAVVVWSLAPALRFPLNVFFPFPSAESEKTAWSLNNFFYIGVPLSLAVILLIIYLLKKVRGSKAKFSPMFWS